MSKSWENDSCATVQAYYNVYPVAEAAALWCNVPPDQVSQVLNEASPLNQTDALGKAILKHPYIKCLEPRIRAIHQAIDNDLLAVCSANGRRIVGEHVAYGLRCIFPFRELE